MEFIFIQIKSLKNQYCHKTDKVKVTFINEIPLTSLPSTEDGRHDHTLFCFPEK